MTARGSEVVSICVARSREFGHECENFCVVFPVIVETEESKETHVT